MLADIAQIIIAMSALGALIVSIWNNRIAKGNTEKINEVHVSINSRMDQLLKANTDAAHAAGVEQERNKTP